MSESDLSDWEWNRLQPLMPKPSTGRPAHDHRRLLNGIFWILRGHLGASCPGATVPGPQLLSAFTAGARLACGSALGRSCSNWPSSAASWTGISTSSTARQSKPTSTRLARPEGLTRTNAWDAVAAGSAPKCTCAPMAWASHWS